MSITNFVPEIWSARLLRHLDAALVYGQPAISNRDYQGEITQKGDTVHIRKVGTPTIVNYVKGVPMTPERPDGGTTPLTIDRDKGYYVQMDDLDAVQADVPLFDQFTGRSGIAMAKVVDADIAARQVLGAKPSNTIGTDASPVSIGTSGTSSYATVFKFAVQARRLLDKNDAPEPGRWMVINPDLEALALEDEHFIPPGADAQRTGAVGSIAGFQLFKTTATPSSPGSGSTLVPNSKILYGSGNYATTVATQFVKTEAERLQGLFEDALKGRNAWGAKVIESETLGVAHVKQEA